MVQTVLPLARSHIHTCTHSLSHTHTHIHTVTIIKIDKACNLLHSGLNRDLCVRLLSLSPSLGKPVMCLFIFSFLALNLSNTCTPFHCYFTLPAHSHTNTLMLPFLPNQNPPTHAHTFISFRYTLSAERKHNRSLHCK